MRLPLFALPALAISLALAACGSTTEERTVVVNPTPGQTVVVPSNGDAHVVDH